MDTSGARFVPTVDLTHDDDDTHSRMSDIPLQLPASAHSVEQFCIGNVSHTLGGDPVQNVHNLGPIPNQTRVNPWQFQYLVTYLQSSLAVLGTHEAVQLVTQRAREAPNDQHETA